MILPKIRVLHSHGRQAIPDLDAVELPPEFRGRPCLTETRDADDAERAAAVCPTGAFTAAPLALDQGRCLICGECARNAHRNVRFTNDFRIGSPTREGLGVRPGDTRIAFDAGKVRPEIRRCFSRALQLREVSERLYILVGAGAAEHAVAKEVLAQEDVIKTATFGAPTLESDLYILRPLADTEHDIARLVLQHLHGNRTRAAEVLGISRTTLWRLLKDNAR